MQAATLVRSALRQARRRIRGERDPRLMLLDNMEKAAVCAEIGVWKGDFSKTICRVTSPKELHLIDPWVFEPKFPDRWYGGSAAKSQGDMDRIYRKVRAKFERCGNVKIHRGASKAVLRAFDGGYFDWVYIDGNHSYEYVLADLRICLSKVKSGGVIAGDDYTWGAKEGFPVKQAVQDFVTQHNMPHTLEILGSQFMIRL